MRLVASLQGTPRFAELTFLSVQIFTFYVPYTMWLLLFQSQGQRAQASQQQTATLTPTSTSATDLRVNSAVNVALSSVAKYWVFTNLFPGPIPQMSVYGLPAGTRIENGKPVQVRFSWEEEKKEIYYNSRIRLRSQVGTTYIYYVN